MTSEQRECLKELEQHADDYGWILHVEALRAALADLDSTQETLAGALAEIDRMYAAHEEEKAAVLADLDACRAENGRLRAECAVWAAAAGATAAEIAAVLAAAGEERP